VGDMIDELASLGPNWDGEGAVPIPPQTLDNTRRLLSAFSRFPAGFPAPPEITPNPNGTVSLDWSNERGWVTVEVGRSTFTIVLKVDGILWLGVKTRFPIGEQSEELLCLLAQYCGSMLFQAPILWSSAERERHREAQESIPTEKRAAGDADA